MTLQPPLNQTPSTRPIKILGKAVSSSCDNSGVVGGKAPITGVSVKAVGYLPAGSTCVGLVSGGPAFEHTRLRYKWLGTKPSGKPMTVARDNTKVAVAVFGGTSAATYDIISLLQQRGAFPSQTITMHLSIASDYSEYTAECFGEGISSVDFGTDGVSTVSVP